MTVKRLELTRSQILGFRRHVGALEERLSSDSGSLRIAAGAGLTDSMPRAALLSLHARVEGVRPSALDDPALVQVWGPRFSAYAVPAEDMAVFTLGRHSYNPARRERAEGLATRIREFLDGRRMPYGEVGRALGVDPNALRYATTTGTVAISWDGARQPEIWTVPPPEMSLDDARMELARRFLHTFGPANAESFATWAGIRGGSVVFDELADSLTPVETSIGDGWILAEDESAFREKRDRSLGPRLLPSGDTYTLLWGADRDLLVADTAEQALLWTPRVWPGAVLVGGEVVGTWRRSMEKVTIEPWRPLTGNERDELEREAWSFPLPGLTGPVSVNWG
jgi:hypothetical protein